MSTYRVRFSCKTLNASIHSPSCTAGQGSIRKDVSWEVEAESAKAAAEEVYVSEEFEDRKLPMPKVCRCAS